MKRILILNGGYAEIPLIEEAKKIGLYVIVTGRNQNAPGNKLADKYISADYSNSAEILRIAKVERVDFICSGCSDFAYFSTVKVCEELSLPGHDTLPKIEKLHYKNQFRKLTRDLGIPTIKSIEVESMEDAKTLANLSFPVIVKPIDLAGGEGMNRCDSLDELQKSVKIALSASRCGKLVVEEFVEGDNHGFTSFVVDSKVVFYMADTEYHEFSEYAVSGTSVLEPDREVTDSLIKQIELIVHSMNLVDGIMHCQYKLNREGVPVIIEICRRCPGDQYPKFVEYATSVNYTRMILKAECGMEVDRFQKRNMGLVARQVLICDKPGKIKQISFSKQFVNSVFSVSAFIPEEVIRERELPRKMGVVFLKFTDKRQMERVMSNSKKNVQYELNKVFPKKHSDLEITVNKITNFNQKGKEYKVFICGVTKTADDIKNRLEINGIKIDGFVVDDEYYDSEMVKSGIVPISKVINSNAIIVIGYYQFGRAYRKIDEGLFQGTEVMFVNRECLFDYEYYLENQLKFEALLNLFDDEKSKATLYAYMDGRMNGFMKPLYDVYTEDQYFIPEVKFGQKEVYVDCGMYDGDTIVEFIKRCPNYSKIYGFEPDEGNVEKFLKRKLSHDKISIIKKGVYSKDGTLRFSVGQDTSSRVDEEGSIEIPVTTIDSLYDKKEPITFIKMDIEGSELEALKGAQRVIKEFMPKLAICVYHKKEDMITIPQYIKSLESEQKGYKFYLRHHSLYDHETVLYAIPFDK